MLVTQHMTVEVGLLPAPAVVPCTLGAQRRRTQEAVMRFSPLSDPGPLAPTPCTVTATSAGCPAG